MKKLLAIFLSVIFIVALSACGVSGKGSAQNSGGAQNSQNDSAQESMAQKNAEITVDEALDIALKDAGLKKSDVRMIENHLDYDDGILVYDIEFDYGSHEYSYEVNAKTGVIIDRDKDFND